MLLIPKAPLIKIKATANKIKFAIVTTKLLEIPNTQLIIKANPVTPPLEILLGNKKKCNPNPKINTPKTKKK